MSGNPVDRTARAAARRLAPEVEAQVEAALHARNTNQYFDPVALGSLIVSTATLAWTVYKDLRNKTPKPARETIAEQVRTELPTDPTPPADLDKIIEVIVDEIIKDAED